MENKDMSYRIFWVKKPSGGKRKIFSPSADLKKVQHAIKKRLELDEWISSANYGFVKDRSAVDCARIHSDKDWVLTIDVKNFFPSIKVSDLGFLSEEEQIFVGYNGRLVQGSPCSPAIANVYMREFDEDVFNRLSEFNIDYSRYADDIILSGYDYLDKRFIINMIKVRLNKINLAINEKKIKFMPKSGRQRVLGINVNSVPSVCKETRLKIRAAIHQNNLGDKELGLLSYVNSINSFQKDKLIGAING